MENIILKKHVFTRANTDLGLRNLISLLILYINMYWLSIILNQSIILYMCDEQVRTHQEGGSEVKRPS